MNAVNDKGSAPLAFCSWILESYDLHQMTHRDFIANILPQRTPLVSPMLCMIQFLYPVRKRFCVGVLVTCLNSSIDRFVLNAVQLSARKDIDD